MRYHWQISKKKAKAASKAFSTREVWNQHVAMVTKLVYSCCGAHVVESYCKESSISDANWLRYLFSLQLIKIQLSLSCYHLANLHISHTGISLEQKETFENSKQYSSSHTDYGTCLCFKTA